MKTSGIKAVVFLLIVFVSCINLTSQIKHKSNTLTEAVLKNDFLVNDDIEGDLYSREPSQVAMNSKGDFVVVWRDERNGDYDIFVQAYAATGEKIGENYRVNDDPAETEQWDPHVAINDSGEFVVTWCARVLNGFHAYFQKYNSDGLPLNRNVQIDPNSERPKALYPSVALCNNGGFVIAWNSNLDNDDVFGQIYNAAGQAVGENFKINSAGETQYGLNRPGIGMDDNGNFVVCWADNRRIGAWTVYAQQYLADGSQVGENFVVNDTISLFGGTSAGEPSMAMNKNGEFVIGWMDYRNGLGEIYAQRFDNSANPVGSNFAVTDDINQNVPEDVEVTISLSGSMVFVWTETYRDFFGDIFAQKIDSQGVKIGSNFLIDDFNGLGIQEYSSVAINDKNEFIISFCDDHGDTEIKGIVYDWSGSVIRSSFSINDDEGAAAQQNPAGDINSFGEYVIAWQDNRDVFYNDIYVQSYSSDGNIVGSNQKVNDDGGYFADTYPDVCISDKGSYVVTWMDERVEYASDIYAQLFTGASQRKGANFKVNEGIDDWNYSGGVAMDGDGNFIIIWNDNRAGNYDVYAQRYKADGKPIGGNYQINDPQNRDQWMADIAMNKSGRHVIVWADDRIYRRRIFARIFEADGTPITDNFNCSDLTDPIYQETPVVSMDEDGNFVVAWYDQRNWEINKDPDDIYARFFNADGTPQGAEFKVNDDTGNRIQMEPSVAMAPEGGKVIIGWTDYRKTNGDPDIMVQKYINGEAIGENQVLNQPDLHGYMHQKLDSHGLASNNDKIVCAWADNRRHKHWDTYGKIVDWGVIDKTNYSVASDINIYPNPASSVINIQSAIFRQQSAIVVVYDLNGRKLIEKQIPTGTETFELNVSALQSGAYLCKFLSGNISVTKKLINKK